MEGLDSSNDVIYLRPVTCMIGMALGDLSYHFDSHVSFTFYPFSWRLGYPLAVDIE